MNWPIFWLLLALTGVRGVALFEGYPLGCGRRFFLKDPLVRQELQTLVESYKAGGEFCSTRSHGGERDMLSPPRFLEATGFPPPAHHQLALNFLPERQPHVLEASLSLGIFLGQNAKRRGVSGKTTRPPGGKTSFIVKVSPIGSWGLAQPSQMSFLAIPDFKFGSHQNTLPRTVASRNKNARSRFMWRVRGDVHSGNAAAFGLKQWYV